LTTKTDSLTREIQTLQEVYTKEKRELEKKLRASQDECGTLREEVEEAKDELSSQERRLKHDLNELQTQERTLQQSFQELRTDRDEKAEALKKAQQRVAQQETDIGGFENEIMRLKTQTGDVDTLAVIKRELSDQVAHIQKLETTLRDQHTELKQYRKQSKGIEVVEEEKRVLETKVRLMNDLRRELSETQLQKQILEEERRSWTAYLENVEVGDGQHKFDSPEDLAKAYIEERLERASLVDQLGQIRPDLSTKDATIASLEEQKASLEEEMEKLKITTIPVIPDSKVHLRLERQRTLAVKEVEYLRAQLKMFDTEEGEFSPEKHDETRAKRLQELEDLVDQYRKETQSLSASLAQAEKSALEPRQPSTPLGTKRPHPSSPSSTPLNDERLGTLTRKNRSLQDSLTQLTTSRALLEKELQATKSQLKSLKSASRIRALELRDNPTAAAHAIKLSTLRTLRAENEALLAKLDLEDENTVVPAASLQRLRDELEEKDKAAASQAKHLMRLKQIFTSKSLEFREAVASILGWKMDFLPNGRVRMTSMFYTPPSGTTRSSEGQGPGDGQANSIIFDGEQGTMKVSGGPRSAFAAELQDKVEFWVEGRKEIPCFLAACTLEFWERGQAGRED
jgi:mitotic spindle assembly checkpoint protein MAD1